MVDNNKHINNGALQFLKAISYKKSIDKMM